MLLFLTRNLTRLRKKDDQGLHVEQRKNNGGQMLVHNFGKKRELVAYKNGQTTYLFNELNKLSSYGKACDKFTVKLAGKLKNQLLRVSIKSI
jgi:hypothetical protein